MKDRIVLIGDYISDVYINVDNISQNQEILYNNNYKGYFESYNIYSGGIGFLIESLLYLLDKNNIISNKELFYLLPDFHNNKEIISCNLSELYDKSIRYLYDKYNNDNLHIMRMKPIDYIHDTINPTVKMRFISKDNKKVYFRFDYDNDIQMKCINCNNLFIEEHNYDYLTNINNILCIIDYNKGYLTEHSVNYLTNYIINNNIKFQSFFLNTKPENITYYYDLLLYLSSQSYSDNHIRRVIQLNEKEFLPIKDYILNDKRLFTDIIVTRGTKDLLYIQQNTYQHDKYTIDISNTIINDVYTTSGCGDLFLANIIFNVIFNNLSVKNSILNTLQDIKTDIYWLNDRIFS